MISVLLTDDQAMVREGLAVLLGAQPGITVVGEAANGLEAVERTAELRPDVVLMDVRMPVLDGIEATRRVLALGGPTRVLVLTTFDEDEHVYAALRAGARGYLLKSAGAAALTDAVRAVAAGQASLAPSVTARLLAGFVHSGGPPRRPETLTARETEVLALIARGRSNAEIAASLVVAEETVKTHISRILGKLGLRDRTQAAVYAYEIGLVVRVG